MANPSWFNENCNRAYPLLATAAPAPPTALIVDAGFMPSAKSRFVTGEHGVKLSAVRRQGAFFYLDFTADAPELYGRPLTFSRHATDGDFAYETVDSGTAGLSASSESLSRVPGGGRGECDEPLWFGFLVTGRAAAFAALLPADGEISYAAGLEPAVVQNLAETFVSKIGVANAARTKVTAPTGCPAAPPPEDVLFLASVCVTGDVVFVPGFNANVRQSGQDNSITFGASVGDGAGQPCDTIPVHPGEAPPAGSSLLEGGVRCNETVRAVNGVPGPLLNIVAGTGVTVTASPGTHTVTVDVDMQGLALCFQVSARSESC